MRTAFAPLVPLAALALVLTGCASDTGSGTPSTTSSPTPTASSPEPSTPPTARALPADCYAIYDEEFLATYGQMELNDPSVMQGGLSRVPEVEALREPLNGLDCRWGLATEGGTASALDEVPADVQEQAIGVIQSLGGTCEDWNGGTLCRYSFPMDGDTEGWSISEQYFFRDGWWVTTWWAGTVGSIDDVTDGIYATLWP
ncbi:hypothetical protein GCM10027416_29490 [Okibacterium endophyticum]